MHKPTLCNGAVHKVLSIIMGLGALVYMFSFFVPKVRSLLGEAEVMIN